VSVAKAREDMVERMGMSLSVAGWSVNEMLDFGETIAQRYGAVWCGAGKKEREGEK